MICRAATRASVSLRRYLTVPMASKIRKYRATGRISYKGITEGSCIAGLLVPLPHPGNEAIPCVIAASHPERWWRVGAIVF